MDVDSIFDTELLFDYLLTAYQMCKVICARIGYHSDIYLHIGFNTWK